MMREITAEQAFEHAACGDAVILDVRPQVVRHQGSVPGALVVEPGELTGRLRLNPAVRHDAEVAVVALNAQADEWRAAEIARAKKLLAKGEPADKVLEHLMTHGQKVSGGDRLGKTIIFAKNQRHAEFIQQRFDLQYPEHAGYFARVITHGMSYAQTLIDDFSTPEKAPHIAISVDMLDTGIDVPEVVNLVFFKPVRSKTKFWQMIGRGTRLCPDLFGPGHDKENFYVFDFCGNLEFFSHDLPTSEGSHQKSLNQRLFETRVGLITELDHTYPPAEPDPAEGHGTATERGLRVDVAWALHRTVAGMNLDNFLVRPHRKLVDTYAAWPNWSTLSTQAAEEVAENLGGLPSTVKDEDEDAKRFDLLILRRQFAQLTGDAFDQWRKPRRLADVAGEAQRLAARL